MAPDSMKQIKKCDILVVKILSGSSALHDIGNSSAEAMCEPPTTVGRLTI